MTTQSFTGQINTAGEWETVSSLTGITFTSGKKYNMYADSQCQLKIADYIVPVFHEKFDYTAGSDDLYIKTGANDVTLAILEA